MRTLGHRKRSSTPTGSCAEFVSLAAATPPPPTPPPPSPPPPSPSPPPPATPVAPAGRRRRRRFRRTTAPLQPGRRRQLPEHGVRAAHQLRAQYLAEAGTTRTFSGIQSTDNASFLGLLLHPRRGQRPLALLQLVPGRVGVGRGHCVAGLQDLARAAAAVLPAAAARRSRRRRRRALQRAAPWTDPVGGHHQQLPAAL